MQEAVPRTANATPFHVGREPPSTVTLRGLDSIPQILRDDRILNKFRVLLLIQGHSQV